MKKAEGYVLKVMGQTRWAVLGAPFSSPTEAMQEVKYTLPNAVFAEYPEDELWMTSVAGLAYLVEPVVEG